jgi:phytoene dehydrogenase-like protein
MLDLAVVGTGHNALVAAAYIARAGYRVALFERRALPGGAVSTAELIPGYRIDLGGSAHILIRLTPIPDELELARYGLRYLELDPLFHASNGEVSWFVYRDLEQTAAELDARWPGQGEAYLRFIREWQPLARALKEVFLSAPGPWELGRKLILGSGFGREWSRRLPWILRPYGEVAEAYFSVEAVRAPLVWMAAQSGPPPWDAFSAPFLLWHPLYHEGGVARPQGGSGVLSEALVRAIQAYGGEVHLQRPVRRILVEGTRVVGLELEGGEQVLARKVLSGAHILKTAELLPEDRVPPQARAVRVGNGFGAILRLALSEPVAYPAGTPARIGLGLLIRDLAQLQRAYGAYLEGEPSQDPPLVAMSFSAVDPTLAPPGGEVLWLWGQYYPYRLARGSWPERALEVREALLRSFERYDPNIRQKIVGEVFQTPSSIEEEFAMPSGNVMHLEMTPDQMFALRPFLGAAHYRWPGLRGLYLTGASTHPGGGIMGASGRNAARVILRDLSRRR